MTPGIHQNTKFSDYRAIQAVNMSTLLFGRLSLAHLRAALDGKMQKDSAALTMGRAFHVRILEPDEYENRVVVAQPCVAILKSGDRKGMACEKSGAVRLSNQWFCGQHAPEIADDLSAFDVIQPDEAQAIEGMRASVMRHPIIQQIRRRGGFETTVVAEIDGVLCKVRFDKLVLEGRPVAIDLKKCRLGYAKPSRVAKAIDDYGYAVRAAFYQDVLAAAGGPADIPFLHVFVEDAEPYAVSVVDISAATDEDVSWLDVGRAEYRRLLRMLREAQASGKWPAYVDSDGNEDITPSFPPQYVVDRHQSATAMEHADEVAKARGDEEPIVW